MSSTEFAERWEDLLERDVPCRGFPEHFWEEFRMYVLMGRTPGGFLRAFFEGDLHEMCRRGGEETLGTLWPMVTFLHNRCPEGCFGSRSKVEWWMDRGGLAGIETG